MADAAGHLSGPLDPDQAEELAELLAQLGLGEKKASVLAFLAAEGEGRSSEIEQAFGLRQPQVSQATTSLRDRGWVEADREKTPGKGRPVNVYTLGPSIEDIVEEVTARRRQELNRELARVERARNLVREAGTTEAKAAEAESPARTEQDPTQGQG